MEEAAPDWIRAVDEKAKEVLSICGLCPSVAVKDFFQARRPHRGLTYDAYRAAWAEQRDQSLAGLDRKQRKFVYYVRYNWERAERVHQRYAVSERLRRAVTRVDAPQLWMVLTEAWCVDSAYVLPVLVEAARLSQQVDLRILYRDANLDLMDQYLSNGTRGIPKLVAFSRDGEERFRWGPRPEEAHLLRVNLRAKGLSAGEVSKHLIDWYEADGWRKVDEELALALEQALGDG